MSERRADYSQPRMDQTTAIGRSRSYPSSTRHEPSSDNRKQANKGAELPVSVPSTSTEVQASRSAKADLESGPTHYMAQTGEDETKLIKRTPLYKTPLPGAQARWHLDENLSIDWGALFYDLVLVAALSAFTSSHRLAEPSDIPAFATYYIIIYFIWVTQVFYDIRYEGEDSVHRLFKFLQICVLIYVGSASGNWDPVGYLRSDGHGLVRDYSTAVANDARQSFTVIVSTLLVSRILLASQYTVCALVGRRLHRRIRAFSVSITSLVCSSAILLVIVVLPGSYRHATIIKITMLYLAIALELLIITFQVWHRMHVTPDIKKIGERYSAVVLIVLGEGLIALVGAFNDGLSGLSDTDVGTYGQAVLAVSIAYLLYTFLFARFRKESRTGRRRAIIFELVHIPLTFGLLLLFGAVVNVVIVISHGRGTASVLADFVRATNDAVRGRPLSDELRDSLGKYLYKMPLYPPFDEVLERIRAVSESTEPTEILNIIALQYTGQIIATSFTLYDLDITEDTAIAFLRLSEVNTTWDADVSIRQARVDEATEYVYQVNTHPFESAVSGTLWLFPVAGIVLMLCSLRSFAWSQEGTTLANLIIASCHMTGGLALSLLGLLGIGDKSFDVTRYAEGDIDVLPMYQLVLDQTPLIIVVSIYAATYLTPIAILELMDRWKEPIFTEPNVSWRRRFGYMTVGI